MPDYSLGRAHGQIEIDYKGDGADQAAAGLDKVAASSTSADKSLDKTQKTLGDTEKQFDSTGDSAAGYSARLKDVESASRDVESAEKRLKATLLDERATLDDVKDATDRVTESKKRHVQASNAARDAHRAYSDEMKIGQRAVAALASIIPNLHDNLDRVANVSESAAQKTGGLSGTLSGLAKVVGLLGPEGKAAAGGLMLLSQGVDSVGEKASASSGFITDFVKNIASFEVGFGKIAGLTLGATALGGLGGLAGSGALQGLVEMADAVKQLSGLLGLLPAIVSGVGFSMGTLKIAFQGVGDALTDMMADDPKKFLEDIKNMGPAAAQSMLQIAQFRNAFKLGAGAVQDSFFAQIAGDIGPLIQTWLPAVVQGMSQVAGIFGEAAHQFADLLMQPAAMSAFQEFIGNLSTGLKAMEPAMVPLLNIFMELTTVGSSMFGKIGTELSHMLDFFAQVIDTATVSGQLQAWIQDGINAFGHLVNIAYSFGSAFLNIMDIADKFGGGGLLGWLEQLTQQFNLWTQSADGQKTLTDFFTVLREATDAFTPVLKPLVEGLASIGTAFVQLGVATAPGWLTFFNTFAQTMEMMAPQIVAMGPAVNTFLTGLSQSFGQLVSTLGPQLPRIFQDLANAVVALLPQIPQLAVVFVQLMEQVGPQLPKFFQAVTDLITQLLPYLPDLISLVRNFISVLTWFLEKGGDVVGWFSGFLDWVKKFTHDVPTAFNGVKDAITGFFGDLGKDAENWGKGLIDGLIRGIRGAIGFVGDAAKSVVDEISSWFPHSPAKKGPFSGAGYTYVRGQKIVSDMAAGMVAEQSTIEAAASSTADAAAGGLAGASAGTAGGGGGGAPSPGGAGTVGNSLLPDNIAGADTSILTAYLRHQFDDSRGLKGLAKDFGNVLKIAQDGFNLINTHVVQPLFQGLGMLPGAKDQAFRKMTPKEQADKQQADAEKKLAQQQDPTWKDVFGPDAAAAQTPATHTPTGTSGYPALTDSSTVRDKQLAIIAKGKQAGLSDQEIQGILGVAQVESNFGKEGFMGFSTKTTDTGYTGGAPWANDYNKALDKFFENYMAGGYGSTGPTKDQAVGPGGQVLDQKQFLEFLQLRLQGAAVSGNPTYATDLQKAVAQQAATYPDLLKQLGSPTWPSVTGTPGPPPDKVKIGADGSISVPAGTPLPPGAPTSAAGRGTYGLQPGTNTGGYGTGSSTVFPPWVMALAESFGIKPSTYGGHQESDRNEPGYAPNPQHLNRGIDWTGPTENLQKFADYLSTMPQDLEQVIWQNPVTGRKTGIGGGQIDPGYYPQSTYDEHGGNDPKNIHVHTRQSAPIPLPGGPTPVSARNPSVVQGVGVAPTAAQAALMPDDRRAAIAQSQDINNGATTGRLGDPTKSPFYDPTRSGITLPSGQSLDALTDTAQQNLSVNDKLLQSYLQGNPALAQQIDAAKTPGASDQTVMDGLTGINKTIDTLTAQDAVGNKNTIDALRSQQSSLASQQGFTQTQSPLATAQSIAGGISNGISGVYQSIQSGLDALTATQDIADRLVYGIRNTEDINKIIDDVQKYYKYAADVIGTAGSIVSTVGSFTGGSDFGGTSAAGSALSMISGVLQGINAAIDLGQQIYEVTMSYVGKFASVLTGLGGTDLMGNVGFLLNKNTGQLLSYSMDNPEQKNASNVPSWMNSWYDYNGKGNTNPQVNQQLNVYAGPGQSPGEMMNETMWMVNTGGTTGAMAPTNF